MRLPLRFLAAAAAVMLLSGCWWIGPPFYKGGPADAGPVRPGVYRIDEPGDGKPGVRARVTWPPDGTLRFTAFKPGKGDEPASLVMVRLAVPGRDLWIVQQQAEKDQTDVSYGLAELHGDELWISGVIDCQGTMAIVRAAGGEVDEGEVASNIEDADPSLAMNEMEPEPGDGEGRMGGPECRFKDRASLERALRAYIATNPPFLQRIRFKRIGD